MIINNKKTKVSEVYYLCSRCGALNTEAQILEEVSDGSCGMCYCEFDNGRRLNKYRRISKKLWEEFKKLKSDKLRLQAYIKYKATKLKNKKR